MQQRDKALQAIKDLIKQKNDEILQVDSEISGVKKETRIEHEIHERLLDKQEKCHKEQEFLTNKKQEVEAEIRRLTEQHTMLKRSMNSTEVEGKKMDSEQSNTEDKMTTLEKSIMTLHNKTKEIRDDITNHSS